MSTFAAVTSPDFRQPVGAATVLPVVVLVLDAIVALTVSLVLASALLTVPGILLVPDPDLGADYALPGLGAVAVGSVFTLVCPAVATLVGALRTHTAHLLGCVVTGLAAVLVAGAAALTMPDPKPSVLVVSGIVFAANIAALSLLLGAVREPPR